MLRALFGNPKKDPYNQAVKLFQNLRYLEPLGREYCASLLEILRLCQATIQRRPGDGDAHILLANAYLVTAPWGAPHEFCFVRAAAAIYHWKTAPMYSKEQANGAWLYESVLSELKGPTQVLGASHRNRTLAELHQEYYTSAIAPSSVDELADLVRDIG